MMVACGHNSESFGLPMCEHIRVCRIPWLGNLKWYNGSGVDSELLEDGPTRRISCARDYDWGHALASLDDARVAIGGIGDDDKDMVDGARIFDLSLSGHGGLGWRTDLPWPRKLTAFAGPAGAFLSGGQWLFSSDHDGLSRWDFNAGVRTGHIRGFTPTHHHRGAHEFAQLVDNTLVRSAMDDGARALS
jgi:hypothetical protein